MEKVEVPFGRRFGVFFGKILLLLLETLLLLAIALYGFLYVLAKGPSPTARDLFVRSVRARLKKSSLTS